MVKKPTGNEGISRIRVKDDGSVEKSFIGVNLGDDKAEIERVVMDRFKNAMKRTGSVNFDYKQNDENDLDFTLIFEDDELVDIDLTELVLPATQGGSPFEQPNRPHNYGEVADVVEALVRRKDAHYSVSGRPKHLLVYTTHWQFMPTHQVLRIVQSAFLKAPPKTLECVFFLYDVGEGETPVPLHPANPEAVGDFDPYVHRDKVFVRFDPDITK